MSTEERGGGGGQGFISGQFCPPLNLPTAEDEQGGHDPPAVAVSSPAAVGSESPPPEIHISPAEAGSPPGVTRGSPLAPVYEQGGRDPPLPLAAAETSLAGSGVAEQEVQQEPPRNPLTMGSLQDMLQMKEMMRIWAMKPYKPERRR